jgi:hypothetical protein
MRKAAAAFAFAAFLGAPAVVWAQDKPAAVVAPAADASTGEITLNNAAVNRAFEGGETQPIAVPVRSHRFGVYVGFRAMNITSPGYDVYSENDAFVQNSLGFSFAPWRSRSTSLHIVAEWNIGSSSAYARGAQTDLVVNRLALGLEGRWMPRSRFYLYAKLVPSAVHIGGKIDDYEAGVTLESSSWTIGLDTSLGAALRLGTAGTEPKRTVSFWLMMDMGAAFAGQAAMSYRPTDIDDPSRTFGAVNLPGVRPGGFVSRSSFAVTF